MDRKDVQRLERHGIVAAQQVLIAQQIGQIGCQRAVQPPVLDLGHEAATRLQTEKLALVEQVAVAGVSPAVQAAGLVARRDRVVGDEARREPPPVFAGRVRAREIVRVGPLEEAPPVLSLPPVIVVFDGEQAMPQGAAGFARIGVRMPAARTVAAASARRPRQPERAAAGRAFPGVVAVRGLVEIAAGRADEHVGRVAPVGRQQVSGEQIDRLAAPRAVERLDPQERLHRHLGVAVARAEGAVIASDLAAQRVDQAPGGPSVRGQIEMVDLLADDPGGHRIEVESLHVAAESIRLDQGGAAAHERVGDAPAGQVVAGKEGVLQWAGSELGQQEAAEQRAGPACEPLVNADDRAVVLLYLLLPQRQAGDQGNVEVALDAHPGCRSSRMRSGVRGAWRRRSAPGRNAFMALRMAKNRPMPYIRGGSPTALAPSGP